MRKIIQPKNRGVESRITWWPSPVDPQPPPSNVSKQGPQTAFDIDSGLSTILRFMEFI
jgi:hypothetical protein